MKPKIIFTVINDLTYDQRMQRTCEVLANEGYNILLVGRLLRTSPPLSKTNFLQHRIRCWFNKGKLFYLEYNLRLFSFLIGQKFNAIGAVDLDTLLPGYLVSRLKRKACVYDAHEYFQEVPEVVDRPITKWIWERLASWIIPRLKFCYTVGPEIAKVFSEKYRVPFEVIRNVPKMSDGSDEVPEEFSNPVRKILLYQGSLNEGRGIEESILAMKQLSEFELWLIGEGDLSEQLRVFTAENGLDQQVKFFGRKTPDELRKITPVAFLGLNLLQNKGLNYYYSLANKCFDYIQAGVPVLNPNFPEYKTINERYQIGVNLPDILPETIAATVRRLLDSPDKYANLKTNCMKARQELNWEKESIKLLEFYAGIFKEN